MGSVVTLDEIKKAIKQLNSSEIMEIKNYCWDCDKYKLQDLSKDKDYEKAKSLFKELMEKSNLNVTVIFNTDVFWQGYLHPTYYENMIFAPDLKEKASRALTKGFLETFDGDFIEEMTSLHKLVNDIATKYSLGTQQVETVLSEKYYSEKEET